MNRAFSASTRSAQIPGAMPQAESDIAPMALNAYDDHKRPLQKVVSLFFADWFFESVEHLHHVLPDFPFLGGRLIP